MRAPRPFLDAHASALRVRLRDRRPNERGGGTRGSRLRPIGRAIVIGLCALACVVALSLHTGRVAAAGYTVNVPTDSGIGVDTTGDLRYAITQVNASSDPANTITITATGTITLASALPALAKPVAITGPGAAMLTVRAAATPHSAAYGVFAVSSGVTASIGNLTIANGNAPGSGGGIANGGALTVTNSTLSGNSAGGDGGGIFNASGATLNVTNTTLSGNGAASGNGGGIANGGTLTVTNSTLSGNSAGGNGGGIYNFGTLTVTNSNLTGNSASSFEGGGGIDNGGTLTVTNSTFSGNNANNGGGIANGGTLTVTNSTFSGNNASNGGGIYIRSGTATVTNSTLSGNSASSGGGGISIDAGTLNLTNTIVAGNTAGLGHDIEGAVVSHGHNLIGNTNGGSGFLPSDIVNPNPLLGSLASNGGPTQTIAPLAGSPAIGAGDAAVCASTTTPPGAPVGGKDQRGLPRSAPRCAIGAFEPQQATYTVGSHSDTGAAGTQAQCLDPNNTACRLRDAIGDATSGFDTIVFNSTGRGTITVGSTLTLAGSVAITGPTSGAGVTVDGGNAVEVFVVNGGVTASISSLTIAHGNTGNSGGGIYNGGTLTVTNSTLSGNSAPYYGGGIFNANGGTLTVTNTTLSGNSASYGGGGIDNDGTLMVANSTISGNAAAGGDGGGIYNRGTVTVTNTTLSGNTATGSVGGGGIDSEGTLTVTNSTLSGNSANQGGGIRNLSGTVTVTNSTLAGNSATTSGSSGGFGGGIDNGGTLNLTNTIIAGNTATRFNPDIDGAVVSHGHNLIGNTSGGSGFLSSDIVNPNPLLGPLADNGGTTPLPDGTHVKTQAITSASPAFHAGDPTACTTPFPTGANSQDERGATFPRSTTACSIGSFEPQGVTLSPATLPNGTVTIPYSQMITASGGTIPYSFAVTGGTLPPGLTLATNGALSGTPTLAGAFAFTVTATDHVGATGNRAYTLVIAGPNPLPPSQPGPAPSGQPAPLPRPQSSVSASGVPNPLPSRRP